MNVASLREIGLFVLVLGFVPGGLRGASVDPVDAEPKKESKEKTKVLSQDKQSVFASPAWTPESDYVLVSRQPQHPWGSFELWMYHVRGGSGVQVTKGKPKPDATPDQWSHAIGAVASPDGKYLYYT